MDTFANYCVHYVTSNKWRVPPIEAPLETSKHLPIQSVAVIQQFGGRYSNLKFQFLGHIFRAVRGVLCSQKVHQSKVHPCLSNIKVLFYLPPFGRAVSFNVKLCPHPTLLPRVGVTMVRKWYQLNCQPTTSIQIIGKSCTVWSQPIGHNTQRDRRQQTDSGSDRNKRTTQLHRRPENLTKRQTFGTSSRKMPYCCQLSSIFM